MTEPDVIFALVRAALEGRRAEGVAMDAAGWWRVFRLAQQNHVAALVAGVLPTDLPREVKIPWLAERDRAERWYRYQLEVQEDIVGRMHAHGIDTLVLKGTHLAQRYPVATVREFGDLDLYFYNRHEEADAVARRELGVVVSGQAHHHTKYDYRGVTVESHYDFTNTHYPPSNRRYEKMLKEMAPSPTFEVLFLLRHMACHFAASRITLRDLVDWVLTCRALQGEVDWEQVQQTVDDYGMRPFVAMLNAIAEKQLGIVLPLQRDNGPDILANTALVEHDMVYGTPESVDRNADGLARLGWKLRRWRALRWKRRMVYSDSETHLLLASLTSHAEKPQSILHKM